tara:strand:+ start:34412 stop:34546 length:135 start_codon:yes stop_codon:yes gene_type:complete
MYGDYEEIVKEIKENCDYVNIENYKDWELYNISENPYELNSLLY